jgi:protein FRA10AC1
VTSAADHEELKQHYTFVPEVASDTTTWQQRMVNHYHSHLYKEYVLADLTRPGQVGLRWRTEEEVQGGRGHATCGNKHCHGGMEKKDPHASTSLLAATYHQSSLPDSVEEERRLLENLPHGVGLNDYEVPFTYTEQDQTKTELVKLRLCLRCAPLLFASRGGEGILEARKARAKNELGGEKGVASPKNEDSGEHSSNDEKNIRIRTASRQHSKHKKRRKHRKPG